MPFNSPATTGRYLSAWPPLQSRIRTPKHAYSEAWDEGSKALFERIIQDEERHADFLEAQLHSIKEMGTANSASSSEVAHTNETAGSQPWSLGER
jgi:hypothetical protein